MLAVGANHSGRITIAAVGDRLPRTMKAQRRLLGCFGYVVVAAVGVVGVCRVMVREAVRS
jgi:hypothetical protein